MNRIVLHALFLAGLAGLAPAAPTAHAAAFAASQDEALGSAVAAELDLQLARGLDADHAELYRAAMIEWADPAPLFDALDERVEAGASRATALWLRGHLEWNHGYLDDARRRFSELVELVPDDARAHWTLGRVYDTLDDREAAGAAYATALEREPDTELEGRIRLRLAMLPIGQADEEDEDAAAALVEFGSQSARDDEESNRAAIVLALDGRFGDALELFTVGDVTQQKAAVTFARELRLAEWSVAAGEAEAAQQHAWRAVEWAGPRRDRRYALGLLVEAHRLDETLDDLIAKLEALEERSSEETQVWIALLRETGRFEQAMEWFRASEETSGEEDGLADEVRAQLLDLCREWGREELLESEYRRLIAEHPASIVWREGLSRFLLEKGRGDEARAVWDDYLVDPALRRYLLTAAGSMAGLGLDDLALEACEVCIANDRDAYAAMLFASDVHRLRGRQEESLAQLERLDAAAPADAPERMALAEAFEQRGALEQSVRVLEGVRAARGEAGRAEDLDMRLAWLLSEVDREEDALALWRELWDRVQSPGRRRYVEQRLMSVASRLGVLADIAIALETALVEGTATDRDAGLLVQLYSRVNDPVSATEVLEMFLAQTGAAKRDELEQKSRIYLECNDYYRYERTLRELMEVDPAGSPDYLRQLAMSALERGQAREAREILAELVRTERSSDSAEFEAGVLALAGLREESIAAYRRGIAANPNRIENLLLLANVMREMGARQQAIGMFQYLAENADEDDLFTIAIDGLLNMEAEPNALRWARRCALERIASRHDKTYLYQLVSDLSEQLDDNEFMVRSLECALPISAERRVSLLRELLDLSRDDDRKLRFGRRLVNSGQLVPPDVYLELGTTFLESDDVANAVRTFAIADSLQEASTFQIDVARIFEGRRYLGRARDAYARALIGRDSDVGLLAKLGEIHEQVGDDASALTYYQRAIDLLLMRQPLVATKEVSVGGETDPWNFYSTRNVDEYDQFLERALEGLLTVVAGDDELGAFVDEYARLALAELEASLAEATTEDRRLAQFPRVARRADVTRRLALAARAPLAVEELDLALCAAFTDQRDLLGALVNDRTQRGYFGAARRLWERAEVPEEVRAGLAHQFEGWSSGGDGIGVADPVTALRRLPRLVAEDRGDLVREVLLALLADSASATETVQGSQGLLVGAAREVDDPEVRFRVLRLLADSAIGYSDSTGVRTALARAAELLPDDYRALLEDHVTREVMLDDTRAASMLDLLLDLEDSSGRDLVDEEALVELVDRAMDTRGYWAVQPFFKVLPEERLTGVLRSVYARVPESSRADFLLDFVIGADRPFPESTVELVRGAFRESVGQVDNPEYLTWTLQQLGSNAHNPALAVELLDAFDERWGANPSTQAGRVQVLCRLERTDEALATLFELWEVDPFQTTDDWDLRSAMQTMEGALVRTSLDAMVERLLAIGEERDDLASARRRAIGFYRQVEGQDGQMLYHRWAAERWPDDPTVLAEFADALRRDTASRWERLAVLERIAELTEEGTEAREDAYKDLERFWKELDHPLERERWDELASAARKERREREKAAREAEKAAEEATDEASEDGDDAAAAVSASASGGAVASAPAATLVPAAPVTSTATTTSSSSTSSSSTPSTVTVPATSITISGGAVTLSGLGYLEIEELDDGGDGEDEESERAPQANLRAVAAALADEEPDPAAARTLYRRTWRSYPQDDDGNIIFFGGSGAGFGGWNGIEARWPGDLPVEAAEVLAPETLAGDEDGAGAGEDADADAAEPEPEAPEERARRDRRGGLDDLREPPQPAVDASFGTYEVLVETEVGRAEMLRQLRTRTAAELDHCGPLFAALAARDRRIDGADAALDALLARFDAGTAGRIELELLLQHLLDGHGTDRDDVRAVLVQLLDSAPPSDSGRLTDIARLLALGGREDWAARLYPWCASLGRIGADPFAGGGMVIVYGPGMDAAGPVALSALLEAVRASLTGAERIAVVEEVLERMRPIDLETAYEPYYYYDPFGSASDAAYVNTVLRTWMEELPPAEALARCSDTIDRLLEWDGEAQPNRAAAFVACEMCAKAGDVERAARLLEIALVTHEYDPAEANPNVVFYGQPSVIRNEASLDARQQHALFPAPDDEAYAEFADPSAWFAAAARTLADLVERDATNPDGGLQSLGLALWRYGTSGSDGASIDGALIDELVATATDEVTTRPESTLWVLDAAVRSGRESAALALERALIDARLLRSDRVTDAVWRAWQLEGEEAGRALAEQLASWTLPEPLLDQLVVLNESSGDAERAEHWREVKDEAY